MSPRARREAIHPAHARRDANRPAQIRADAQHAASRADKGGLAARAAARDQSPVERVHALPEHMVIRVGHHHRLREVGLHVQHRAEAAQGRHDALVGAGGLVGQPDPA